MVDYWAVTTPPDPTAQVLVRVTDTFDFQRWVPHLDDWVTMPSYADIIYGDEPGARPVDEAFVKQAQEARVGDLTPAALKSLRETDAHIQEQWASGTETDPGAEPPVPGVKASGGLDQNRGNAEDLRHYWTHGAGAAKIQWGVPGDFKRCVALLSKYMGTRAKGYCQLRHHDALGVYAGQEHAGKAFPFVDGRGLMEFKAAPAEAPPADAPPTPDGVMVALYPPLDTAEALAGDGRTPPTDMHVTLAYLGKTSDVPDPQPLLDAVRSFAAAQPEIGGQVSGTARFVGDSNGDPFVANVDSPDLPAVRERLVQHLTDAGFAPSAEHAFTPHITLTYLPEDAPTPTDRPNIPVQFGILSVAHGADVYDIPMAEGGQA